MTTTQVLVVLIWVASGLLAAVMMGRRGHSHWYWSLVALLLGPFAWPVLDERSSGDTPHTQQLRGGKTKPGIHLVVGVDGSPEAAHAATVAVDVLNAAIGRVTLATVVDYDAEESSTEEMNALARSRLRLASSRLKDWGPAEAVLMGPPVKALTEFATEQAADLIVVGPRGRGLSQRLLGSVASGLVSGSPTPVLVIGGDREGTPSPTVHTADN